MANPDNIFAIDDIKFITGLEVRPVVATETSIKRAIDRFYESADSLAEVMRELETNSLTIGRASLSSMQVLGGVTALEVRAPFQWKTVALWVALALGGVVVLSMVFVLARELNGR